MRTGLYCTGKMDGPARVKTVKNTKPAWICLKTDMVRNSDIYILHILGGNFGNARILKASVLPTWLLAHTLVDRIGALSVAFLFVSNGLPYMSYICLQIKIDRDISKSYCFCKLAPKKYMNEMTNLRVFQISQDNKYATGVEASKAESVTPG